jgi:protein-tyrosine kinase
MGKLSDALARHKEERSMKLDSVSRGAPNRSVFQGEGSTPRKESFRTHEFDPKVVAFTAPDSAGAESFKIIRTQLLFSRNGQRPQTIMVTSALPGEGKTFVAVNLAVSLALGIDEHVLLMDCDLRRPQVHTLLGYRNEEGLNECLTQKKRLEDLVIETQNGKLSLLTAGKLPQNPTELLSSSVMRSFLQDSKEGYKNQFIIIDSAPYHGTAEAKVLAEYVDGIIFVAMAQRSQRKDIQKAIDALGKEKILGIFFNGYDQANKSYYDYYERYYGRQ